MTIKESSVQTHILGIEGSVEVPVFYTDSLNMEEIYDFAYSSAIGEFLPYLFVGYFTDEQNNSKWYFANARRHEEMREAIEHDHGGKLDYSYGQIWFNTMKRKKGELRLERVVIKEDISPREEAIALLLAAIEPGCLQEKFDLYCTSYDILHPDWKYEYRKAEKALIKIV